MTNSLDKNSLSENSRLGDAPMEDLIPRKMRFREGDESFYDEVNSIMPAVSKISWKNTFLGVSGLVAASLDEIQYFEILEGDVRRSIVNGMPSIEFFNRINQILIKSMETTLS